MLFPIEISSDYTRNRFVRLCKRILPARNAKAGFSELVRLVHSEGPQHVTVHGRDEVVVMSAEEFYRLKGGRSGELLVAAMQGSPHREIEIEPARGAFPQRDVVL